MIDLAHNLIFSGILVSLFLITLICSKNTINYADKYLMLWLLISATHLIFLYDSLSNNPLIPEVFNVLLFSLPLLGTPVFYLYVNSLAFSRRFSIRIILIHSIFYVFYNLTLYFLKDTFYNGDFIRAIPQYTGKLAALFELFTSIPLAVIPVVYIFLIIHLLQKFKKLLPENYSNTKLISLNWLKVIVYSEIILFIILFFIIKFGLHLIHIHSENLFLIVGAIICIYVFLIGYFAIRQSIFSPLILLSKKDTNSYQKTGLDLQSAKTKFEKLEKYMSDQKPYMDENLNLASLAKKINISPNHLSQIINQVGNENFFNYINKYRVHEVKNKLKDPGWNKYTILAIAYECGFRSKSSFNKIFKQITGQIPSEYKKSLK